MAFFGIPTRGAPGLGFGATKIVGRKEEEDPTEYKAPEYNLKRIKALTQEQLAPTTSGVRRAIQRVQAGRFQTPTARKEALRGAIRGGGEALGAAQAGAVRAATALYAPEFEAKRQEELLRYKRSLEKEREEKATIARRGASVGGETYREATERLLAYDPWGSKTEAVKTSTTPTADYMSRI